MATSHPFENGVASTLASLAAIPVLPTNRAALLTTIASHVLHLGAIAARNFVTAAIDNAVDPSAEIPEADIPGVDHVPYSGLYADEEYNYPCLHPVTCEQTLMTA